MVLQDNEGSAEKADVLSDKDTVRIAQLEAELQQARHQIAELQHLLKYRTVSKPPPLALTDIPDAAPSPLPEAPVVAPLPSLRRVQRKIQARRRRTAVMVAVAGLVAGILLGNVPGRSSGSKPGSFDPPQRLAAAQLQPFPKPQLIRVSAGPVIAPGENGVKAESAKPAVAPPSAAEKKPTEAPVVKPKRHRRHPHKAPEGEPAKSLPAEPPIAPPPDTSPPETEPG